MNNLLIQAKDASRDSRDCRKTIDTLRGMGFGDDAFRPLHRHRRSMAEFYSFAECVQRFRDDKNNHRVHQRLTYVLLSCPDGVPPKGESFQTLVEEAFGPILPIQ